MAPMKASDAIATPRKRYTRMATYSAARAPRGQSQSKPMMGKTKVPTAVAEQPPHSVMFDMSVSAVVGVEATKAVAGRGLQDGSCLQAAGFRD